jgi:hypothetical protein
VVAGQPARRARGRLLYERLLLRFGAVSHIELIASEREDCKDVWNWLRSVVVVKRTEMGQFLNSACGTAAEGWGAAIRAQVVPWDGNPREGPPRLDLDGAETVWGRRRRG